MTRAFVIGNGPSLNKTPLELLKHEVCFGVNKIGLIYDKTSWRPTHYVRAEDWYSHDTIQEELKLVFEVGCKCWINKGFRPYWVNLMPYENKYNSVNWFTNCPEHGDKHYDDPDAPTDWHLPRVCGFGGSVSAAIQYAVLEGFEPIYLLGCDLGYKDGEINHFDANYESKQLRPAEQYNGVLERAHEIAEKCSPVPIYNATLGGELEVYPRVDLTRII